MRRSRTCDPEGVSRVDAGQDAAGSSEDKVDDANVEDLGGDGCIEETNKP